MQSIIEFKAVIVLIAFVLLFVIERFRPATPKGEYSIRRIFKNLLFWPLNIGLSLLIVIPVSYFATTHSLWQRPEWLPALVALGADLVLLDLFIFWWHRSLHEIPFLWHFHEVHHLDEHLDTTTALRFHFGEVFLSALVRAVVIVGGAIPFSSVVVFETIVLVLTFFHHSNIAIPARCESFLSKAIVTPSIHWVHHHALRKDTDSNYGTIFSFWDHLFETKSLTSRFKAMTIGVDGCVDKSFLSLLVAPFKKHPWSSKL